MGNMNKENDGKIIHQSLYPHNFRSVIVSLAITVIIIGGLYYLIRRSADEQNVDSSDFQIILDEGQNEAEEL